MSAGFLGTKEDRPGRKDFYWIILEKHQMNHLIYFCNKRKEGRTPVKTRIEFNRKTNTDTAWLSRQA